jgi:hypothetical protein
MIGKRLYLTITATVVSLLVTPFLFALSAGAVSIVPSSGSFAPGSTQTFQILASPPAGQNAVALRLSVTGMTITGFTDPSGVIAVTGDCTGSVKYTSTQVCVSMAKTTDFQSGDPLGTFTATIASTGSASIVKDAGTEYSDGVGTTASTGTGGTYTISTSGSGGTTLPNTSSSGSTNTNMLLLITGLTMLSLGALSYVSIDTVRRSN